ncbi:taste receptor type 2 member 140-like [Sorex araneus]|uniref:taste receptor type 2 member 140-like n=1 Tax=Sorex araneus TaxID=42254 RepID=UPI002433A787|nr:taste receptor type 2 member 140-like [Sorex araneus]
MVSVTEITILIVLSAVSFVGILGNSFIVLITCMDWIKRRKMSPVDQVLAALAISRMAMLSVLLINSYAFVFASTIYVTEETLKVIAYAWTVTNHFSIWLATSLSIYYFLKIASFPNSIFLYLKWRVSKVVSVVLLVTLTFLIINMALVDMLIDDWFHDSQRNMTHSSRMSDFPQFSKRIIFTNTMFTLGPFSVTLTIFLLLIFSLWRHLRRVLHSGKDCQDASTKAHFKAMQSVIAFLVLYAAFFLSLLMSSCNSDMLGKNQNTLLCQTTGSVYPAGHSCALILGNRKLRQAFLSVLWWLGVRVRGGAPSRS